MSGLIAVPSPPWHRWSQSPLLWCHVDSTLRRHLDISMGNGYVHIKLSGRTRKLVSCQSHRRWEAAFVPHAVPKGAPDVPVPTETASTPAPQRPPPSALWPLAPMTRTLADFLLSSSHHPLPLLSGEA